MAHKAVCIITSSEDGKGAYGITRDSDENVYFPVKMAEHLNLEEYEEVEAILIKNERPDPPFMAIRARRLDEA